MVLAVPVSEILPVELMAGNIESGESGPVRLYSFDYGVLDTDAFC